MARGIKRDRWKNDESLKKFWNSVETLYCFVSLRFNNVSNIVAFWNGIIIRMESKRIEIEDWMYRAVLSNGSMTFVGNYVLQSWKQYCLRIMCEIMSFGSEGNGNFKLRSFWKLVIGRN